jgi:muramidase (phage lysozyme)
MSDPRFVYRPLLDLIGYTEGTDKGRGYNETLAYGALTGGPVDLVGMTLDQVDALQTRMLAHPDNGWNSSAAGRYQIVRTTLRSIRETLGLTGKEKYDAGMQDRMGCFLLGKRGIDLWLAGSMTDEAMINELAKEWASLPTERDVGYYDGQKARVKSARVREVLAEVRARHEAKDQQPDTGETPPAASLPEMATIEAVTRLAAMTPEQLHAAAMTISMAQAIQGGWKIEDPAGAMPAPSIRTPGITFTQPPTETENMNGVKSWFQSKGVVAGLASVAALIGPIFGLDLGQTNINDAIVSINQLVAAVAALVSIWGRITAKSQIAGGLTGKG